jgi:hypothetical protein
MSVTYGSAEWLPTEERRMPVIEDIVSRLNIMGELLRYFWQHKWWWLMPMLLVLMLFGVMAMFAQSSAIAPLIYTLF